MAVFTSAIVNWINKTPTNAPLTDLYETIDTGDYAFVNGKDVIFSFRPVVGGVFAPLAV